ncbi:MAG TPA: DUF4202 family protein [Bacteroidetes bacterium]|nr:DUF4202 family protein [Bacteroidota bacterium]
MLKNIELEIETIISKSKVPEDSIHSQNTREWVLKLKPEADTALQMAALGHDIERSIEERKIKRENFTDYNEFKKTHSQNSAAILQEILLNYDADQDFIDKVVHLVLLHEVGGTPEANILKYADSISFFDVNLPFYFQRNSERETAFRMKWGYKKLSQAAKSIVRNFSYDDVALKTLFNKIIS